MSYTRLLYHVNFSTKERVPFLVPDTLSRVCQYMGGIVRELDGQLLAANGARDHVHLAVAAKPTLALADLVRIVKANSSKWVHASLPGLRDFGWQDGYGGFTVSSSLLSDVLTYIDSQPEHHKRRDFKQQFIELLRRHGIPFDEKYLWA